MKNPTTIAEIILAIVVPFILIAVFFSQCDETIMPGIFGNSSGNTSQHHREPWPGLLNEVPIDAGNTALQDGGMPEIPIDSFTDWQNGDTKDSADDTGCMPTVYTFTQGVDNYFNCTDIEIRQGYPDQPNAFAPYLIADEINVDEWPYSSRSQILIRMDNIFGYDSSKVPQNAHITNARLQVYTWDGSAGNMRIHQMLTNWDATTTWNSLGGVTTNGEEAVWQQEERLPAPAVDSYTSFDVTAGVSNWQKMPNRNQGWVIINSSDDAWGIVSSDADTLDRRPTLFVEVCGTNSDIDPNLPPELIHPNVGDPSLPVGTSPVLEQVVVDPENNDTHVTFYGREIPNEFWSIIVLPDTQYYTTDSQWDKGIFPLQTQWIVNNKDALNIQAVLSAGDITEDGRIPAHWERADTSLSTIIDAQIPYMPSPGDHDHEEQWEDGALTLFSDTFPESRFSDNPWWGGSYDDTNSSSFMLLTIGSDDYIFIGLDFCPDDDELAWAGDLLDQYADRKAILITHSLLDDTGDFWSTHDCGRHNDESIFIWDDLVSQHDNLQIALSGHMHRSDGEYNRTDDNINGVPVHLAVSCYQMRQPDLGNGLLRIMTFYPSEDKIEVKTYSPYLGAFETDADSEFTLHYEMNDEHPFVPIGTLENVRSGDHATLAWPNLNPGARYEWYAVADDGKYKIKSPTYKFETVIP